MEALLRPVLLSLLMSGLVAFVAIVRVAGAPPAFGVWFASWMSAWIVAFPALLVAQPIVNRVVTALTTRNSANDTLKETRIMNTTTIEKDTMRAARMDALTQFYGALSTGDADKLDQALIAAWDEEPRNPGQGPGREPMKQFVAGVRQALPDLTIEIRDVMFDGDKAAVRAEMRGSHSRDFFGVAATGKPYVIRLHEFHTFDGEQIAYTWHLEDWFGFLNQIGAWPVEPAGDDR
ncbi:ester cyclase [Stakelama pacifica]|uniref:ester cyclase n=1 Tax=Stakelama pacifica TaxID=517720 RepID=UPI00105F16E3|nr:ester cyclase [Stakelama pacifica]